MSRKSRLDVDGRLIELLACGASNSEAAKGAGVDRRTVFRRQQDPEFRSQVESFRDEMLSAAAGKLAKATGKAIETLESLLTGESDSVRLGAARGIIDSTIRIHELTQVVSRISALEAALKVATAGRSLNGKA